MRPASQAPPRPSAGRLGLGRSAVGRSLARLAAVGSGRLAARPHGLGRSMRRSGARPGLPARRVCSCEAGAGRRGCLGSGGAARLARDRGGPGWHGLAPASGRTDGAGASRSSAAPVAARRAARVRAGRPRRGPPAASAPGRPRRAAGRSSTWAHISSSSSRGEVAPRISISPLLIVSAARTSRSWPNRFACSRHAFELIVLERRAVLKHWRQARRPARSGRAAGPAGPSRSGGGRGRPRRRGRSP